MQAGSSTTAMSSSSSTSAGKPDRLYVGNLAPTVDEYTLLQVVQKYGKITKLDFMYHKSGALKGKPRGYAFVEFSSKDDALKAMVKLHDRLLRGRKLVVTYANSAPPTDLPPINKGRRIEPAKTTTLSLLKSQKRPHSAAAQIAAMEAKLASMQSRKPADETYVPGQSFRILPPSPAGAAPGTGSNSPSTRDTPDAEELDLEEELGLEAGGRAAEDLEREMAAILQSQEGVERTPGPGSHSGRAASPAAVQADPVSERSSARTLVNTSSQPTRPSARLSSNEPKGKGLASLPKKPSFL